MKRSIHFRPTLLAVAISAASAPFSYAEETDTDLNEIVRLETIEIKGQAYRNTATKTQLEIEETPQAITIVSSEELEERGVESLSEALRYSSGVHSELRGGAITRFDFFNVRGFSNNIAYYDGLQLPFNGWNIQPQIDSTAIEQIEVFKGPTSTLYGATATGGMVNMISKSPQDESSNSIDIALGSDNKTEVSFDSTGAISEGVNYRVLGLARQKDAQSTTAGEERIMIAPSIDIEISEDTQLNINMYYQNDPDMGVYSALPSKGTVYENINGQLDSDAYAGDAGWETYEREVLLFGYKLDHTINNTWSLLQNARVTLAKAYQQNVYSTSLDSDESTLNRRAYITDEASTGFNIDNQLSGLFDLGNAEHNILAGIDYQYLTSDIKYEDAVAATIDLYDPDYYQLSLSNLDFAASGYSSDFNIKRSQLGLYLQDQIRVDQWVLIAGGRYDQYDYEESGTKYGSDATDTVDASEFSGRVAALYQFENGLSPFASYSQSFEALSGSDSGGNVNKPSISDQIEAGLKYTSNGFHAGITAYEIIKDNFLTPTTSTYVTRQVEEARSRGIEIDIQKSITPELNLATSITFQEVEITEDSTNAITGNTPIRTPDKLINTWLSYQPNKGKLIGSKFNLGVRHVGKTQVDAQNSDTVPSYTLVDFSVGYDLSYLSADWQGVSLQFAVSNAFDEVYYTCYDTSNCWFGADRYFELKGRYEF
ncbi:TonB-dependent siderophore receptor [Marinomonas sp. C2222]|uniref:TonB-dependent siderophore receptor n=1 Tax=Marinomonas sargassi TaxID=2984494 RepID=A0ABT2YQ58_9GAMM|nr:TonB-dependent siderophore receptor [Marinomonas sargassi]MCV2402017.1 TonB-dependent siderophore receptor [Marinomonas sargassi]